MTTVQRVLGPICLAGLVGVLSAAPVPTRSAQPDEKLLAEVQVPPPGLAESGKANLLKFDLSKTSLIVYADRGERQEKLRRAVRAAQILLWATSPADVPPALQTEVKALRARGVEPAALKRTWSIPTTARAETAFKEDLYGASRQLARVVIRLEQQLERLQQVAGERPRECKRWQAHYDLVRAWLMLRILHLEEVSLAMGQMRRESMPYDPKKHKAWKLSACETVRDLVARKIVGQAEKQLDQIMKDYPDTVWADLAARNRVRSLGVEWVAVP